MSIDLRFTEQEWQHARDTWTAWWAGKLPRPIVVLERLDPVKDAGVTIDDLMHFTTDFPLDVPVDDVLDFYQARLEAKTFYGDDWPKWWPNFGPGIAAGFLGAQVKTDHGTVWFEPAEEKPLHERTIRIDEANPWWQRVQALTARAVERWGSRVSVGFTDIGGNLDILASLHGTEQLLFAVIDSPEIVEQLSAEITDAWLRYYDTLDAIIAPAGAGRTPWATVWSTERTYMLQSDFAYMISPQMFERFVLPDLARCCDALDHAFYHMDGKGQIPHLDMLLSLERLRGIQWIPGAGVPPPEDWPDVLKRIRDGGKLCQLYTTAAGALKIVRELGGRGFAFHITEHMTEAEAADFLQTINTASQ